MNIEHWAIFTSSLEIFKEYAVLIYTFSFLCTSELQLKVTARRLYMERILHGSLNQAKMRFPACFSKVVEAHLDIVNTFLMPQTYMWASIIISSGPIYLLSWFLSVNMSRLQIKKERHFLETDQINKTGDLACWSNLKKQNKLLKLCCKRNFYLLIIPEQSQLN